MKAFAAENQEEASFQNAAVRGKQADPKPRGYDNELYSFGKVRISNERSLLLYSGVESRDRGDSSSQEKKHSNLTFHLESQDVEKTRNKQSGERLGKKTVNSLLIIGLLAFWFYCLLPRSKSPKEDDLLDEHGWSWEPVPLDWLELTNSSKVVLAVLRKNATSKVKYKGPLFINPGGPNGSGVRTVKDRGKAIHVAVGSNHDLIGFDPRGISVAIDMLEILNKLGYENLRYWGISYGTIIGGTFAAMYPDKIERLGSDGNANYYEWYNGTGIHYNEDTHKVMLAFFQFCHAAGPQNCAFYASTLAEIQGRLEDIYTKLRRFPLQVFPYTNNTVELQYLGITRPKVITYSEVKRAVIYSLFQPLLFFPELAEALASLEVDYGISFLKMAIAR
ncbi:hypothetical protein DID88_005302 [Monilinia fructigena]|uniref:Uncharacterized protein n=1 Tax=Monilinia fructigena TaxID=38457 RepID=A0A395IZE8_9HELO|nr:hypothetical protein DID88_005302 [Monilinia fructigena]